MSIVKFSTLILAFFIFPVCLSAQQVIADYNLCDNGGTFTSIPEGNETLAFLNDKNENTLFTVPDFSGSATIQYTSPTPIIVTGFSLVSSGDETANPTAAKLEASLDGTTWKTLYIVSTLTFPGKFQPLTTKISIGAAYKYYRLTFTKINGGTSLKIAEYQLFGSVSPLNSDLTKSESGTLTGQYPGGVNYPLSNVINDDLSKFYRQTNTSAYWIQYAFDQPQKIKAYSLTSTYAVYSKSNATAWEVFGSNDGVSWDLLDTRSNRDFFKTSYNTQLYEIGKDKRTYDWSALADAAQATLINDFWATYGTGKYLKQSYHINSSLINSGFNYWWMAHGLDVFVDGYSRTLNLSYKTKMTQLYNGMSSWGGGSLHNSYYDDMEWMGLACLRAYQATNGSEWKSRAITLWNWIKGGWTEVHYGGIMWEASHTDSKNACSNAPAAILAARLYKLTNDQAYLDWAIKIVDWMDTYLIFPTTGLVKDGYANENTGWTFTYNQGTWIGACMELYTITGEQKYLDKALRTCDYIVNDRTKFSPYGILSNGEGGGDGGLFKGIFMRYLSQMILTGQLDKDHENAYVNYMIENAKSLCDAATLHADTIFGNNWISRPTEMKLTDTGNTYDSSIHLSGTMLFELLAELERKGFISGGSNLKVVANSENSYKYVKLAVSDNSDGTDSELNRWQLYSSLANRIQTPTAMNFPVTVFVNGNEVSFKGDGSSFDFSIFDLNGQIVKTGKSVNESYSIRLPKSVYIIQLSNSRFKFSQKICLK